MLQTWNKFCFTTGYIEVSVTFPGPDQNTQGYVSLFGSLYLPLVRRRNVNLRFQLDVRRSCFWSVFVWLVELALCSVDENWML